MRLRLCRNLGRLDILHNNVGASIALGDAPAIDLTEAAFDRSFAVNLKGMWLACKHAMPALRESSGSIVNISSLAAVGNYPLLGYKTMKAAVIALTENLAMAEAEHGVRVNCILPGLMNTPMAIENRVAQGTPRADVIAASDRRVPLRRKMGSGWDVAYASLFLHSDEAQIRHGRVDAGRWRPKRENRLTAMTALNASKSEHATAARHRPAACSFSMPVATGCYG